MNSLSDKVVGDFRDGVLTFFLPIAEKHKLRLTATSLTEYAIPMTELTVRIRLIPSHTPDPVVSFFSNDPKWLSKSPLNSWGVNLLKFVQFLCPDFDFANARLSNRAQVTAKLALLAELLAKYCDSILGGDLTLWQVVSKRAEEEVALKSAAYRQTL